MCRQVGRLAALTYRIDLVTFSSGIVAEQTSGVPREELPRTVARELRCPLMAGYQVARWRKRAADRQRVNAGARASPSWIGVRHRPSRFELYSAGKKRRARLL